MAAESLGRANGIGMWPALECTQPVGDLPGVLGASGNTDGTVLAFLLGGMIHRIVDVLG